MVTIPFYSFSDNAATDFSPPRPYFINEQGFFRKKSNDAGADRELISKLPVWVIAKGHDEDSVWALLLCDPRGGQKLFARWVRAEQLASKRDLVALAQYGFPFNDRNSREIVKYLEETIAHYSNKAAFPIYTITRKQGWHGNAFVLGEQVLAPEPLNIVPAVQHGILEALRPAPSCPTLTPDPLWCEAARKLRAVGSWCRVYLAACLVPMLLEPLGVRTFVLHLRGHTRRGKTTALKLGLSAWGKTEALIATMNSTETAFYERAVLLNDLPFALDETTVTGGLDMRQVVYGLSHGKERARSGQYGTLQQQRSYRLVVLSTGETDLISEGDTGGVATRVLQVEADEAVPDELARLVNTRVTKDHYGTIAPILIHACMRFGTQALRTNFSHYQDYLSSRASPSAGKYVDYVAAIVLADVLLSIAVLEEEANSAEAEALAAGVHVLNSCSVDESAESLAQRALALLNNIYIQNLGRFQVGLADRNGRKTQNQIGLWSESHGMIFYPDAIDRELKSRGHNPLAIWRAFKAEGWLIHDHDSLKHKAGSNRMYIIKSSVWTGATTQAGENSSIVSPATVSSPASSNMAEKHSPSEQTAEATDKNSNGPGKSEVTFVPGLPPLPMPQPEVALVTTHPPRPEPEPGTTPLPRLPPLPPTDARENQPMPSLPTQIMPSTASQQASEVDGQPLCGVCAQPEAFCSDADGHEDLRCSQRKDWLVAPQDDEYERLLSKRYY